MDAVQASRLVREAIDAMSREAMATALFGFAMESVMSDERGDPTGVLMELSERA